MVESAPMDQMRNLLRFALSVSGLADSRETLRVMPAGAVRGAADGRDQLREVCGCPFARAARACLPGNTLFMVFR